MKIFLFLFLYLSSLSAQEIDPSKITLYYLPTCPHSQEVLHFLSENHKTVPMKNLHNNPRDQSELKMILGEELRVPCLVVDGEPILGAEAIIQWLEDHLDLLESEEKESSTQLTQ